MSDTFAEFNPGSWQEDGVLAIKPPPRVRSHMTRSAAPWNSSVVVSSFVLAAAVSFSGTAVGSEATCVVAREPYRDRAGPKADVVPSGKWAALDRAVSALPAVGDADFEIDPFI